MKSRWIPYLLIIYPAAFYGLVMLILKGPLWLLIGIGVAGFVVASYLVVGNRGNRWR